MYNVGNTLSWGRGTYTMWGIPYPGGVVHVQCREYLIQGEWYMYNVGNTLSRGRGTCTM